MNKGHELCVVGAGYVGLSLATLLGQKFRVHLIDTDKKKIKLLQNRKSPIEDKLIETYLLNNKVTINASDVLDNAKDAKIFFLALPTNFEEKIKTFNTATIEKVIKEISTNFQNKIIVIKSTVPVGFTRKMQEKFNTNNIIFSPEFLREGRALEDNLRPSRIIVGKESSQSSLILSTLKELAINDPNTLLVSSSEAEAIKLFSNAYLASRVTFFNEVDSFCMASNLSPKNVIDGISLDPRIGDYYNNPSFGYGGYCLPKDTKQIASLLKKNYSSHIRGISDANKLRKKFIAHKILDHKPRKVGVFRLIMKKDSDNIRESSILEIIEILLSKGIQVLVYEPYLRSPDGYRFKLENNFNKFKKDCDIIITNRLEPKLKSLKKLVFTRDIYGES